MAKRSYSKKERVDYPNWTNRAEKQLEEAGKNVFGALIAGALAFGAIALFPIPGAAITGIVLFFTLISQTQKPRYNRK